MAAKRDVIASKRLCTRVLRSGGSDGFYGFGRQERHLDLFTDVTAVYVVLFCKLNYARTVLDGLSPLLSLKNVVL